MDAPSTHLGHLPRGAIGWHCEDSGRDPAGVCRRCPFLELSHRVAFLRIEMGGHPRGPWSTTWHPRFCAMGPAGRQAPGSVGRDGLESTWRILATFDDPSESAALKKCPESASHQEEVE